MEYFMACPTCGEEQKADFRQLEWPGDILDPAQIRRGMVHYRCCGCGALWDEEERNDAVRAGQWKPRQEVDRPESVWFHVPPRLSRFVAFHDIVSAYVSQLADPTPANVANFYNDFLGLPTPDNNEGEILRENELYQRREEYSMVGESWQIPMQAVMLTTFTNVQANRLEVEVLAWGEGHESWGIEYKVFHGDPLKDDNVWNQMHQFVQETTWEHESGSKLKIIRMGVDIGFGSKQVSNFIRRNPRRYVATKGSNTAGMPLIPNRPSQGKYGVNLYVLGTEEGKSTLFSWLTSAEGSRFCHFPKTYDLEYFRMLCSERPIRKKDSRGRLVQVWEKRKGYTRNEALDIRVGNIADKEMLNPNYKALLAGLTNQDKKEEAPQRRILSKGIGGGSGWVNKWKGAY
jgi:phage terminase large subunit GpA-like protein